MMKNETETGAKPFCSWPSYVVFASGEEWNGHENNTAQPKTHKWLSSPSHFSLFNCCLSVDKCSFITGIIKTICMFCTTISNK